MKVIALSVSMFFCLSVQAFSDEKLTVLTEDWPPFNYKENGKLVGISTDLVLATLVRAGFAYEIKMYPWKRAYQITIGTPNTILFTTSRTEIRENLFKWVGPLYPRQIIMYKLRKRADIVINNIDDLKNYQLGILLGGSVQEYLTSNGFKDGQHYQAVATEHQNLIKLFKGRVDLIPGSEMSMAFRMKDIPYKYEELQKAFVMIDEGGYYIAINNNTSDIIVKRLQTAFDSLIDEGLREQISMKYLGFSITKESF